MLITKDIFNTPFMTLVSPSYTAAVSRLAATIAATSPDTNLKKVQLKHLKRIATSPGVTSTSYTILSHTEHEGLPATRLSLVPHTGKTHQLRMFCRHVLRAPIVDDVGYGPPGSRGVGMCLAAKSIELRHPGTGERMRVEAEVPF